MTAEILAFPAAMTRKGLRTAASRVLSHEWTEQHGPLVDAAMDLLQADDREFRQRCRAIVNTEGPTVLDQLAAQLDRLSVHLAGLVTNLSMVAKRIRRVVATEGLAT